jgi:alpha-N-arabinofuranosidase
VPFLDNPTEPAHWSVAQDADASAAMELDRQQPLNASIPVSLRLDVSQASSRATAGVANEGYWGIPVKPNTRYRASFFAKGGDGFAGPVTLSIRSEDGRTTYATARVSGITREWKQFEATLRTGNLAPTARARYAVTIDRPGRMWLSLVSLFPPTFNDQVKWIPPRSHADAHRHEADVAAVSRWQLSRRRHDR